MLIPIGKIKKLNSIELQVWNKTKARSLFPVAIIDDEKFILSEVLRKHNYHIDELGDIDNVKLLNEYSIIACDIIDVASSLGSKHGGLHLIKEIRYMYPDKYLIAFSAKAEFNPTDKQFFDYCDTTIKKDADSDDWIDMLDNALEQIGNPVARWIRTRNILLENGLELYDVLKLEQTYIKAIKSQKPELIKKDFLENYRSDNKEIIVDLVISLGGFIAKLIAAGIK